MKRIIIFFVALIVVSTSCKKYLDDAYKNPNLPTYAPPEKVLQSCISAMHRGVAFDARFLGYYTQNFSQIPNAGTLTNTYVNAERHGYNAGSDLSGDIWRMHYWNMGYNIIDMIDSSRITGKYDYVAAAYTLNAWSWVTLADVHGETPVKQAFEKGRLSFDYDNQNVAYEYALRYCDSALANWSRAAAMPSSTLAEGDFYFFQGDQSKWVKFVNGIKARIYHRYSKKSSYLTKEVDSVIKYTNLAMSSTNDDAMIKFNMSFPDATAQNFFGPRRNNLAQFRVAQFPMNMLTGSTLTPGLVYGNTANDPRVRYMFRPSPNNTYNGITSGQFTDNPSLPAASDIRVPSLWGIIGQTSGPALGLDTGARTFFRNDSKFPIMTYSEMQFTRAEAYFLKGDLANARIAYLNGINGHFDMLNTHFFGYLSPVGSASPAAMTSVPIPAADRAAYLADPNFAPPTVGLSLKHIMCQKYLALWGWGFVENWVDMRRYSYDDINIYPTFTRLNIVNLFTDNGGKLAERVRPRYNSEYLWNIDALAQVGGFNPDYHTKKVWFSLP
jgi:Starch-binding associating with outer membrane